MLKGRQVIYTDCDVIDEKNVIAEVNRAFLVYTSNKNDIETLYNYYRGVTAIESKTKEIRPEINHKICENRAYEITQFYLGYTFGSPVQYVRRESVEGQDAAGDEINDLNAYMSDVSKASCDTELAEWLFNAGTAYRLIVPNKEWTNSNGEPPFEIYTLDPRNTFVIYSSDYKHEPVAAVMYVNLENGGTMFNVYTKDYFYEYMQAGVASPKNPGMESETVLPSGIIKRVNDCGEIPIIEYPSSPARLGVFEVVISLLDAINELQSNRMDDIVQYVNSFLAIVGGDVDEDTYNKIMQYKMVCVPTGADVKYIGKQMSEVDVQTLKDDLYMAILTITGLPNRNGGSSTSDTGVATQLRDGWQSAEARASAIELMFKKSEKKLLRIVLDIMKKTVGTKLTMKDIDIHFTRRNYENIVSKAQVLTTLLENEKVDPELAFVHCGMFVDPEGAYLQSMKYREEQDKKKQELIISGGAFGGQRNNDTDSGTDPVSGVPQEANRFKGSSTNSMSSLQVNYHS